MNEYITEVNDENFAVRVLQSEQPVLVDFGAAWCAPCRMMSPTIAAVAEKYHGTARVSKLNVDDNPGTPQRYGIKGIPTVILFRGGREVERIVGAVSQDTLARMLNKYVTVARAS